MKTLFTLLLTCLFSISAIAAESTLHAGDSWENKSKKTRGSWKIIKEGEKTFVVLGEKFKTSKGPDLKLFASPHPISEIGKKQKIETDGKLIAELKKTKGAQRYEVPSSVSLDAYQSLVIHCEKYTVVWGGVSISK